MPNHQKLLETLGACFEALEWYDGQDSYRAWRSCPRGDWLLWIAEELDIDRKLLVGAACDCAELVLQFVPEGEYRPRLAVAAARGWIAGTISLDDLLDAAWGALSAEADTNAWAAWAAFACARACTQPHYAADAAGDAAHSYAATCDMDTMRRRTATAVRKAIPWLVIREAIKAKLEE